MTKQDRILQEITDLQADIEALLPLAKVWSKTKLMLVAQATTMAALAAPYWIVLGVVIAVCISGSAAWIGYLVFFAERLP